NQFVRSDFAAGNARDDAVQAASLQVGQEAVVRILKREMVWGGDRFVPRAGQDGSNGRFADLAAASLAVRLDQLVEGAIVSDPCDLHQFAPRQGEVFAQVVVGFHAGLLHLGLENVGHQRQTTSAAAAGSSADRDV